MKEQYSLEDSEGVVELSQIWDQTLEALSFEVTTGVYEKFLKVLKPGALVGGTVSIIAPGAFVAEWVRDKFIHRIAAALSDQLGQKIKVEIRTHRRERDVVETSVAISRAVLSPETAKFRPSERLRFDNFIVGQSNRMAFAGAKAVVGDLGNKFNPLFIYSQVGLGKTHLMHSIAHELLLSDPKCQLAYVTAQQFAEDFVHALQTGKMEQFRRNMRNVSVWLVDDIQFIAGKDKTQEEFFHTFNYLYDLGKQIVICADKPPRDLFLMDERLRSRFEGGLVADIQSPDTETRCAILLSKADMEGIELSTEIAMYLAENVPSNVRVLEGALKKIDAQASLMGDPITLDLAVETVNKYYRVSGNSRPGMEQIIEAVGRFFRIEREDIRGASRKAPIVHARHIAVYIVREITGDSWKHIGTQFGSRDHTSAIHGHRKVSEMMAKDRDFANTVKGIIRDLDEK